MPIQFSEFEIQHQKLYGLYQFSSDVSDPCPAVLFLHGFLANKCEAHRLFVKMARLLEKEGIASLRFDFRGCGDSEGDSIDVSIDSLMEDACCALENLKKQPHVDPDRIILVGMSLGGGIAAMLAGKLEGIKGVVMWAPVANLMECTEIKIGDQESTHILKAPYLDYNGELVGQKFLSQIAHFNPAAHLEGYNGPVKLIHGTEDSIVPAHQSEIFEKAFAGKHPASHSHLITDADHQFSSVIWQEDLFNQSLSFIKQIWS